MSAALGVEGVFASGTNFGLGTFRELNPRRELSFGPLKLQRKTSGKLSGECRFGPKRFPPFR